MLQRLLQTADNRALVGVKDDEGWYPLHYSSWYGHTECVGLLLQHGASPLALNDKKSTAVVLSL